MQFKHWTNVFKMDFLINIRFNFLRHILFLVPFFLLLNVFFCQNTYSDSLGLSVSVCDSTGACGFKTPASTIAIDGSNNGPTLQTITFTFYFSNFQTHIIDDTKANTIYFKLGDISDSIFCTTTISSLTGTVICGRRDSSSTAFTDIQPVVLSVPTVSNGYSNGKLIVKLTFLNNRNLKNSDVGNPTDATTVPVYIGYDTGYLQTVNWQIDKGAFKIAPTLKSFSYDSAFQITWDNSTALSAKCINSGSNVCASSPTLSSGGAASALMTTNNSLSGYILAYWKQGASSSVTLNLKPNFVVSYVTAVSPSNTSCASPVGFDAQFLLCSPLNYTLITTDVNLDVNKTAAPNLTPTQLNSLIGSPGKVIADAPMNYVYVTSDQSSWVYSPPEGNGSRYGVTMWALNNAQSDQSSLFTTPADTTLVPNYSIQHSPVIYAIASESSGNFATLAKDASLSLSKSDCFVVTSASGDINSKSVFYWRAIRDFYFPISLTQFYYRHAKLWANYLDGHPKLKPPLNFVFEKSGYGIYHTGIFLENTKNKFEIYFKKLKKILANIWSQEASAEENVSAEVKEPEHRRILQPGYEFGFTSGILFPTEDKSYYESKYGNNFFLYRISLHGTSTFWMDHIGMSVGGSVHYDFKNKERTVDPYNGCCGPTPSNYTQTEVTSLRFMTALATLGVRYRSVNYQHVQIGFYSGVGVTRLREETLPQTSSTSGQQVPIFGVTSYQPMVEVGGNFDVSLSTIANETIATMGHQLKDVLFRLNANYDTSFSKTVTLTGYSAQAGFSFLFK